MCEPMCLETIQGYAPLLKKNDTVGEATALYTSFLKCLPLIHWRRFRHAEVCSTMPVGILLLGR